MYQSYYNLKRKPFQINTDPRFLWLGEKHKEALATLKYGIRDNKGFLLLTGEIGTGKTTLINALLNSLEENVIVASISDPALSRLEFFQYVAISFGIRQPINSKVDFLMHFSRFLQDAADNGQKVLLIFDEAQRLTHELLEEIRLLSNLEHQQAKLINIFFVGQSEFNQVLEDPRNKALRQRISVNYHIDTLSEPEVADYIRHRLLIAGSRKVLFNPDAVHQVFLYSDGFPRLINIICDRALLTGYVADVKQIKGKIIKECARELELPQRSRRAAKNKAPAGKGRRKPGEEAPSGGVWRPFLVGGVLVAAAGLLFFNANGWHEGRQIRQLREIVADLRGDAFRPPVQPARGAEVRAKVPSKPPSAAREAEKDAKEKKGRPGRSAPGGLAAAVPKVAHIGSGITEEVLSDDPPATKAKVAAGVTANASPTRKPATGDTAADEGTRDAAPAGPRSLVINFGLDSNVLSPIAFQELDQLARVMRKHQQLWAVVTGYTDTSGFYHYNKKISESRANMVKSYLVGRGIPAGKIQTLGKGPEDPVASNETAAGREQNRRVEIELVKGDEGQGQAIGSL